MKKLLMTLGMFLSILNAEQVKITADSFDGNEKKGISTFNGNVQILKGSDELNASKVVVLTNANRTPYKYTAQGKVSFYISMPDNNATYRGDAEKVVYYPLKKEYQFYKNVHLYQVGSNRKIFGEEVILNANDGNARAIGKEKAPVIMIFNIPDSKKEDK